MTAADGKRREGIVEAAWKLESAQLTIAELRSLYTYLEPEVSADGTCSREHTLKKEPFDLARMYGLEINEKLAAHPTTLLLRRFKHALKELHARTKADWMGIYLSRPGLHQEGDKKFDCLVKHSYLGAESRALFPLSPEFAKGSNNSTVGLTKKPILVQDVRKYNGPYYECSSKVLSEFCAPILRPDGQLVGIMDVEAHKAEFFTEQVVREIEDMCADLGKKL